MIEIVKRKRISKLLPGFPAVHIASLLLVGLGVLLPNTGYVIPSKSAVASAEKETATTSEAAAKPLDPLEVVQVTPRDLIDPLPISGDIKPIRKATISAQVGGLAEAVNFEPGDKLHKGDVLLQIEKDDLELTLRQKEASLAGQKAELSSARSNLNRAKELAKRNVASQKTLEQAESSVESLMADIDAAQAQVEIAQLNLDRAVIRAPFSGTVVSRSVEPDQLVQSGAALFEMIDLSMVTMEAMVPLSDTLSLRVGQKAELSLPQKPDQKFVAKINRINAQAEAGTRSAIVYLTIDNPNETLRAGMFMTGSIALKVSRQTIAIPRTAIFEEGGVQTVLIIRDGVVHRMQVATGSSWDMGSLVEINSGLHKGDVVIAQPLEGLSVGDQVHIKGN
nr:efflux RND transporter periplasmic adaptor subunit [uncultured Cohaesibacter sp.]